jgi:hypothetical protein
MILALVLPAAGCAPRVATSLAPSSGTTFVTTTTATIPVTTTHGTTAVPTTSTTSLPPPTSAITTLPSTLPTVSLPITTATITSPPSTLSTTVAASTYGALGSLGSIVYAGNGCLSCHGNAGQGPNGPGLWGTGQTLGTFNGAVYFAPNAKSMLDFITGFMPQYAPGSLSHTQYIEVMCYILIQNNIVNGQTLFNESQLASVSWH